MKKLRDHPAISVITMILFLIFWYRDVLIFETLSVSHDGVKAYPFFHFLVQNIQHGIFPLWSPHTHAGEPFWTYIQIVGLTNPIFTLAALAATLFNIENLSLLYHWSIFIAAMLFNVGVLLAANRILTQAGKTQYHWIVTPILFLGSVSLLSWGQVFGITFTITWFPYIVWFLLEMFRKMSLGNRGVAITNALLAGLCLAFQLCSFNPAFVAIALIVYACSFALWVASQFLRGEGKRFGPLRYHALSILVFITTTVFFSLPMMKFLQHQEEFFPIARSDSARYYPQNVTYGNSWIPLAKEYNDDIGTSAMVRDFFSFTGNMGRIERPLTSEIPILLGPFGLGLVYIALLCAWSSYYLALAPPTIFLALLSLGAKAGVSIFLYNHFQSFSFIRHLEFFLGYVFFGAALLMVVGVIELDRIFSYLISNVKLRNRLLLVLLLAGVVSSFVCLYTHPPKNLQTTPPVMRLRFPYRGDRWSNSRVMRIDPIRPTSFYRDDYISQAEPLFFYEDSARFYDNATQFIMPARYWDFLKTRMASKDPRELEELLGIRKGKLRITAQSKEIGLRVIDYNANTLAIEVNSPSGSRLFLSQNKVPGWRVLINGQEHEVPDASNHPFFEFGLPEGKLKVEFRYRPTDLEIAYAIHYFGQLLFFSLLTLGFLRGNLFKSLNLKIARP